MKRDHLRLPQILPISNNKQWLKSDMKECRDIYTNANDFSHILK